MTGLGADELPQTCQLARLLSQWASNDVPRFKVRALADYGYKWLTANCFTFTMYSTADKLWAGQTAQCQNTAEQLMYVDGS